ncbi:MAG: hypothetical protein L0Y54_22330 [Sporichthyaceae bacterium]|nr:hypothetical protein [Sporichthyaceae bacterium]
MLAALTAGVPAFLVVAVGWPLPDHLPTLDEVASTLSGPVSEQIVINAIACLVWFLWSQFALCVAVELRAGLSQAQLPAAHPAGRAGPDPGQGAGRGRAAAAQRTRAHPNRAAGQLDL